MSLLAQIRSSAQTRNSLGSSGWSGVSIPDVRGLEAAAGAAARSGAATAPKPAAPRPMPGFLTQNVMTPEQKRVQEQERLLAPIMWGLGVGLNNATNVANQNYDRAAFAAGVRDAAFGQKESSIRNSFNTDLAGIGLDRMSTAVSRDYIGKYDSNLVDQLRVAQGEARTRNQQLDAQDVLARITMNTQQGAYDRKTGEVARQEKADMRQMLGDQAAVGATSTYGTQKGATDIASAANMTRGDLTDQNTLDRAGFNKALNDIKTGRDLINWDLKSTTLSIEEQRLKLQEREKQLQIEAARHNISEQQLRNAMERQLAELGLDRAMSVGQLLDAQNSKDAAIAQASQNFAAAAAQAKAAMAGQRTGG